MIPGGYETKRYNFIDDDFDKFEEDEDEDEFVLDFSEKPVQDSSGPSKRIFSDSSDRVENGHHKITPEQLPSSKKISFFYEINNNFHYDKNHQILEEFKSSILSRNLTQVKNLMTKHNLNTNCVFKSNWSPLMYAANTGDFEIAQYFVENSADVNFSQDSFNVLMCACGSPNANEFHQVKIVDLLLKKGVDVNSCDKYLQTPLMYACRAKNFFLVDLLIKNGAKVNSKDDNGWTSLCHAAHNGCLRSVKKLLNNDADPLIYTNDYLFPFDLAKKNGYNQIYQLLKNYLRMKKMEKSKNSNFDDDIDEFEDFDDGLNRNSSEDLDTFLIGIGLKNLISLFKTNKITLKTLLNCKNEDLKKLGVNDQECCDLMLGEIKKFHQKNWQSSSSIRPQNETVLSCSEAIAIVSNLSRQLEFIDASVKFLQIAGFQENKDFFADDFASTKLKSDCANALRNCKSLNKSIKSLCENVNSLVKPDNQKRIDEVTTTKTTWNPCRKFATVAFTTIAIISTAALIKKAVK